MAGSGGVSPPGWHLGPSVEGSLPKLTGSGSSRITRLLLSDHHGRESPSMATTARDGVRVLGIDPGLNVTGYAVVEPGRGGPRVIEAGVIRGGRKPDMP